MLKEKEELEESGKNDSQISCDIIGDNIDITRSPSQMSVDRKRQVSSGGATKKSSESIVK